MKNNYLVETKDHVFYLYKSFNNHDALDRLRTQIKDKLLYCYQVEEGDSIVRAKREI